MLFGITKINKSSKYRVPSVVFTRRIAAWCFGGVVMEKIGGIYKITSKIRPNRCYIGSTVNLNQRWYMHKYFLCKNKHTNIKLQNHYNKYGADDLVFEVLTTCDNEELIPREQFFIDAYSPYFNICKTAGNTLGFRHSEESKVKMSLNSRGRGHSHTDDDLYKMAQSNPLKKLVIDIETGVFFISIREASKCYNIGGTLLSRYLSGNRKNRTTLRLVDLL